MLILIVLSFSIQAQVTNTVVQSELARWLPPVWFLGLNQVMAVILGYEVDHAGIGHVGLGAAQLLRGHVLAGDALNDLWSGDEHLRLASLNDKIGERRA